MHYNALLLNDMLCFVILTIDCVLMHDNDFVFSQNDIRIFTA